MIGRFIIVLIIVVFIIIRVVAIAIQSSMETAEGTGSAGRSDLPEGIWSDPNANVDLPEAPSYGVEKMTTSGIAGNVGTSSVTATPVGNPSPDPSRSPTISAPPTSQPTFTGFRLASQLFRQLRIVVGNGTAGYNGNNLPAGTSTLIQYPRGLWTSSNGDLYFSEKSCLVRKIDAVTRTVSIIGGSPKNCVAEKNQQQAPFTTIILNLPYGIAGDTNGKNLYVADATRIFRIDLTTMNATLMTGDSTIQGFSGDDHSPARGARFGAIRSMWLNNNGVLFIADQQNHRIRAINVVEETIVTVAGNGTAGFSGDSLIARNAMLSSPVDAFQDSAGILYFSDMNNNRIRRVSLDGIITTIAGTGSTIYNGDQILATMASLSYPRCIRGDSIGILYVADSGRYRIRSLQPVSIGGNNVEYVIDTVAGTGTLGGSIYPSPPLSSLSSVFAMWLTTDYRLYLAEDQAKLRVLMPSFNVTSSPSCQPTEVPSLTPSYLPSMVPSHIPLPTELPTEVLTLSPSFTPTLQPTLTPSNSPSVKPSIIPTTNPSEPPSTTSTSQPTFTGFRLASQLFRQLRIAVGNGTAGYNGNNLPAVSTLIEVPFGV